MSSLRDDVRGPRSGPLHPTTPYPTPHPTGVPPRPAAPAPGTRSAFSAALLDVVGIVVGLAVGLVAGGAVIAAGTALGLATGVLGFFGEQSSYADAWSTVTFGAAALVFIGITGLLVRAAVR